MSTMSAQHMALVSSQAPYHIRHHPNKEPEWSSICNDVFDQYLDSDALFGVGGPDYERNSSNNSVNLFDFSGSSEQSHRTDATSPLPTREAPVIDPRIEARQPKAQEPSNFWQKTLKALERNAVECEIRQHKLRSSKSHPDFLSLGGNPSPPAIPSSPTYQAFPLPEQRLPRSAANGKRRVLTSRSLSRGHPSGVTKAATPGSVNPQATLRSYNLSPAKMTTPSRYRAGFKDLWAEKIQASPKKYMLRLPSSGLPASPPPSARVAGADAFAAFSSAAIPPLLPNYDEHISPLANTFQQTHIHTPIASPTTNYAAYAHNSGFEPLPPNAFQQTSVPLNDTAPLYPERLSSLATDRIAAFEFGFPSSLPEDDNAWTVVVRPPPFTDHLDSFPGDVLPSTEPSDFSDGQRISCDPSLVSHFNTPLDTLTLPALTYARAQQEPLYYPPTQPIHGLPTTPTRRSRGRNRSLSPSPPATDSRASARKRSTSRHASRHHRRTKSTGTTSTPRHHHGTEKAGGFVNYTPDDSSKILNGVAPSGSSKTKARREKEAADKRKRLSQAAIRAVVAAGGDPDVLGEVELLM